MNKLKLLASYAGSAYVGLIGILILPLYIDYMGVEAFGLVGFFAMLQAWSNLLDVGLTPTAARETARFNGGSTNAGQYRALMASLEGIFLFVAVIVAVGIAGASEFIGTEWLHSDGLPDNEIIFSVIIMGGIIALRWLGGLYRGVITGGEQIVWLSVFNIVIATIRFILVLPVLVYLGSSPLHFFIYQLCTAILELTILVVKAYKLMPTSRLSFSRIPKWYILKPVATFSLSIAGTTIIWILVSQIDKLLLSNLLSLAEYGQYTLAVMAASGLMLLGAPVSVIIMPLMTRLAAEGHHQAVINVYKQATQLVCVVVVSAASIMCFFAVALLYAWIGDKAIAENIASIFIFYVMGNAALALAAFPYYLQYAKGNLRLHVIGNICFAMVLIPTVIWATRSYGGIGAAAVWFFSNFVFLCFWVPFVHSKIAPGLNREWYGVDIVSIAFPIITVSYLLHITLPESSDRWDGLLMVFVSSAITLIVGFMCAKSLRNLLFKQIKLWIRNNYASK